MIEAVDEGLWQVETPLRVMGVEAGRRMAVIRLSNGDLMVHSPAELTPALRAELDELGPVRHVVPSSRLHGHLFMEQYAAAYPEVRLYAAPGLAKRRRDLAFHRELGDRPEPAWEEEVDQVILRGNRLLTEVLFFHCSSRTLIVGDCVWNVTPATPRSARLWAGWRLGVRPTPFFGLGFGFGGNEEARVALERVHHWNFDRILIGHGENVESGGKEAFFRTYGSLLLPGF